MDPSQKAYIKLHLAVILFGFTAILGNVIDMSAVMIVWWRVLITSVSLYFLINIRKDLLRLPFKTILIYAGIGVLIAAHWICFYGAIKLANSSIALICAATVAFFTSIIEPLINRRKWDPLEILLGFLIIPGMYIIVQSVDTSQVLGIWAGLGAALLAAIFSILNKKYLDRSDPYTINFIEMVSATAVITFLLPWIEVSIWIPPTGMDWLYMILLALVCTTFTNVITLQALEHLTAFASNLVFNFEPLYGIILAAVLLQEYEQLTPRFYLGGALIILIVLIHPILQRKLSKSPQRDDS